MDTREMIDLPALALMSLKRIKWLKKVISVAHIMSGGYGHTLRGSVGVGLVEISGEIVTINDLTKSNYETAQPVYIILLKPR
jgi:glycine cleavage system aminomethyltransferase T